jgi:monoamine oxidase
MRAIVIGAGLAGLAAADELARAGAEVVVLEARDRVGGRVWSRELDNGAVVEMGAEFVLPGNTAVRELAKRLGLELVDKGMSYGRREPRGGAPTSIDAMEEVARLAEAELARDASAASLSARELLGRLDGDPGAAEAVLARIEVSAGDSADQVAAGALAGIAHLGDEPCPSVAGGNQGLALGLARELGGAVKLGTPALRVAWDGGGVRVAVPDGDVHGDACVVAVPASVAGRIFFDPPLPDPVAGALGGVRYGHAAKLFVPLRGAAAPSAVLSVPERYWTWTANGAAGEPQPVVSAFAGSPAALAGLGTAAGPDRWLESVAALRPELELDPGGAVLSTWDDDTWVGAAYSVAGGDSRLAPLREPLGPLAFAGEHLGGAHQALMEGALRSGREAAARLLPAR